MIVTYFCIKKVFNDNNGEIKEKLIKETTNKKECVEFLKVVKRLNPDNEFYMYKAAKTIA